MCEQLPLKLAVGELCKRVGVVHEEQRDDARTLTDKHEIVLALAPPDPDKGHGKISCAFVPILDERAGRALYLRTCRARPRPIRAISSLPSLAVC